jgi:hypothetical protein
VIAEIDTPGASKNSRESLHDTSNVTSVMPEWREAFEKLTLNSMETTSFKEKAAGYYGTTAGLHTLTVTVTPNFLGTIQIQGTLSMDPVESEWFDIDNGLFTYNEASPGYNMGSGMGQSPVGQGNRSAYLNFSGLFTYTRARVVTTQGAVMFINFNY